MNLGSTTPSYVTLEKSFGLLYLSRIAAVLISEGGWGQILYVTKNYLPGDVFIHISRYRAPKPSSKSGAIPE